MAEFPKISLVLGGVSSGKSAFAERLVRCAGLPKSYIATAKANDDEMQAKIAQHQKLRGSDWQTVESPLDLADALAATPAGGIILVDCLTLWLSNHMFAGSDLDQIFEGLITSLTTSVAPIVLVSNEVGLGGIADTALARQFQRHQGRLNQRVAEFSDLVVMVTAGLPTPLKGRIPEGVQ